MDDLISRQTSVLTLLEKGQKSRRYKLGEIWELNFDEIREALETVPSVDAVEVVRCKDCKWYDTRFVVCHNPRFGDGWANYQPPKVREDFFCNDGERKADG